MTREPEEPENPEETYDASPPPYSSRYSTREPEPRAPVSPVTISGLAIDSKGTATLLKQEVEAGDEWDGERDEAAADAQGQLHVEDVNVVMLAKLDAVVERLDLIDNRLQAIEKKSVQGCCTIL